MNIKIHKAQNQENTVIEISTATTKILLDAGTQLEENEAFSLSDLQAQYDFAGVSAVFLSHRQPDYITTTPGLLQQADLYSGEATSKIVAASQEYKGKKSSTFAGLYKSKTAITVGDIKVTPFPVDAAAYEAYLLLIEGEGKSLIYTGDLHATPRKNFEDIVKPLPKNIDLLLCEGGIITEADINPITEREVEEKAAELMAATTGPVFILQGATDTDRARSIVCAAKRNKRVFLEDLYMAHLAAAGLEMPNPAAWVGVRAYLTTGYKADHFRYKLFTSFPRLSKAEVEREKFVMCVRPSMKKYMKTLSQSLRFGGGLIINALPDETQKAQATLDFMDFAEKKGLKVATVRRSNHGDAMALSALIKAVNPKKIAVLSPQNLKWLKAENPQAVVVAEQNINC